MSFRVVTFGPYAVKREGGKVNVPEFWAGTDARIPGAFGIYIFAERQAKDRLVPWYIGRTLRRFQTRIESHFRSLKVVSAIEERSTGSLKLELFFIAILSDKKAGVAKRTTSRAKWVKYLEIAMIGKCWPINPKMVNDKETRFFSEVTVPGYLDNPENRDGAAQALAAMLDGRKMI